MLFARPIASLLCWLAATGAAMAFGLDDVAAIARREAAAPYRPPAVQAPAALATLRYDDIRDIRYRPDKAVWRNAGLPFELQFFHLGGGNRYPVQINEVDGAAVHALPYDPAAWDFGRQQQLDRQAFATLGVAGLRVHQALNTPAYKDEVLVFLGASYFRALGRGQQYGLSARGLAIDTVGGASGEEFPRFKAFWIERPAAAATTLTVHALLDSPRVTGAYRFTVQPGDDTVMDVQMRLFMRAGATAIASLGIAPLTSMFLHGENQPQLRAGGDFRPEVHDSDGLLLATSGVDGGAAEWLWRPLVNPRQPLVSSFAVQRLQGFGLLQRDRRFASYEDTEAHYERRPSAWVEPVGDWGPGRVELLQFHTPDETNDNIVAYWVPAQLPGADQPLALGYRLHWHGGEADRLQAAVLPASAAAHQAPGTADLAEPQPQGPAGWTVQSRRGQGWGPAPQSGELQFIVDFDGPALRALPARLDDGAVQAVATAGANARIGAVQAYAHPQGGWRMQLRVQRSDPAQPTELRAFLQHGASALTETWTALIPPD